MDCAKSIKNLMPKTMTHQDTQERYKDLIYAIEHEDRAWLRGLISEGVRITEDVMDHVINGNEKMLDFLLSEDCPCDHEAVTAAVYHPMDKELLEVFHKHGYEFGEDVVLAAIDAFTGEDSKCVKLSTIKWLVEIGTDWPIITSDMFIDIVDKLTW